MLKRICSGIGEFVIDVLAGLIAMFWIALFCLVPVSAVIFLVKFLVENLS